jgi:hypothetical protein
VTLRRLAGSREIRSASWKADGVPTRPIRHLDPR